MTDEMEDDLDEYQRPRRANPDTISYLISLPLNVAKSNQQVADFLLQQQQLQQQVDGSEVLDDNNTERDDEFPPMFFAAMMALLEVANHELASLAADERGSECVEILARICLPYSATCARIVLSALRGYHVFLSTHRFGSHVLQTILQLVSALTDQTKQQQQSTTTSHTNTTESQDLGLHPEAPAIAQSFSLQQETLADLMVQLVDEILPFTSSLVVHVCGSHVLRSLLCCLGGVVQIVPSATTSTISELEGISSFSSWERRGKFKEKKKKKNTSKETTQHDSSSSHPTSVMVYVPNSLQSCNIVLFQEALKKLTEAMINDYNDDSNKEDHVKLAKAASSKKATATTAAATPGRLQELTCHPSAGPLLVVLLRVLTYSEENVRHEWQHKLSLELEMEQQQQQQNQQNRRLARRRIEPTFSLFSPAHQLVQRLLCIVEGPEQDIATSKSSSMKDEGEASERKQPYAPDIIYGLAGEARGSHVLEAILCLSHDKIYESVLQWSEFTNSNSLREYLEHAVSNFCIVTLLSTVRTAQQAEKMLTALDGVISSGYLLDPRNKRRAVLWRAVEMSAKFGVGQDSLVKSIQLGFATLNETDSGQESRKSVEDQEEEIEDGGTKKPSSITTKRRIAASVQLQDCIRPLLGLSLPGVRGEADSSEGNKVSTNTNIKNKIHLDVLGTRTVYHMLRFAPHLSVIVVNGIVNKIARHELELIAKDGLGSCCIMDGILDLVSSPSLPARDVAVFLPTLQQLLSKLNGRWIDLALDRVGHHCVIKLFQSLERIEDKEILMTELVKSRSKLKGNAMGRKVVEVCALQAYVDSKEIWHQMLIKRKKREDFLNDIVHDDTQNNDVTEGKRKRSKQKKGERGEVVASVQTGKKSRIDVESIMNAMTMPKSI